MRSDLRVVLMIAVALLPGCSDAPARPRVTLGATHTLDDAGLLDTLAAGFRAAHPDTELRLVVSGTGEVLAYAAQGQVDVVLSHAPSAELAALQRGEVEDRRELMYNEFVIVGPPADPAAARAAADAASAFARIAATESARFVSRDDSSGTHLRELELWQAAGARPRGDHAYIRAGVGMADALRIADQREAYTLTDPATYAVLRSTLALVPLVASGAALRNTYAIMRVTAAPDSASARVLMEWLAGPDARRRISEFGTAEYGRALFMIPDSTGDG